MTFVPGEERDRCPNCGGQRYGTRHYGCEAEMKTRRKITERNRRIKEYNRERRRNPWGYPR